MSPHVNAVWLHSGMCSIVYYSSMFIDINVLIRHYHLMFTIYITMCSYCNVLFIVLCISAHVLVSLFNSIKCYCSCVSVHVEMNALDIDSNLTNLGATLARLPIEPRMGQLLILGCIFG